MISLAVSFIALVLLAPDIEILDGRGGRRSGGALRTLTLRVRAVPIRSRQVFDLAAAGEEESGGCPGSPGPSALLRSQRPTTNQSTDRARAILPAPDAMVAPK